MFLLEKYIYYLTALCGQGLIVYILHGYSTERLYLRCWYLKKNMYNV